jgi:hypothetical protein
MSPEGLTTQSIELPSGELRLLQPEESAALPDSGGVEWAPDCAVLVRPLAQRGRACA